MVFAIAIAITHSRYNWIIPSPTIPSATRYIMVVQSWYSIFEVGIGAMTVAISSWISIDFAAAAAAAAVLVHLVVFIYFRK